MRQNQVNHTINNGGKCVIVITWTYNFGTLIENMYLQIINPLRVLEKEKMTEENFKGKGNAIWTLCNAQLALIFPKQPSYVCSSPNDSLVKCVSHVHTLLLTQI